MAPDNTDEVNSKVKPNDRVRRSLKDGCQGVVRELRTDVTAHNAEAKEKSVMATILWDNGTQSSMTPDSLELVKE